jgi:hypothetical protein
MRTCVGCHQRESKEQQYLCRECWFQLPPATRARLRQRDREARNRLFQLYSAIHRGVPLADIQVAA